MSDSTADVVIVGAGLAGLSAAVALSGAGARVVLLDRKPYVGGRAYSYHHPTLDEEVDSQHVMLGCCTNLVELCTQAGADRYIRWYDRIQFLEPGTADRPMRRSEIGADELPAPSHATFSFLRAPMLSVRDKVAVARGLLEFLRGYPASDDEPFSAWLQRTGQTERAIRHFWEPVIVGALNDTFDRCSTRYAGQVFHESFLVHPEGGRLGIPTRPLSSFYAMLATLAERQGTELRLRSSVEQMAEVPGGGWSVRLQNGTRVDARFVLLALPFEQTATLLKGLGSGSAEVATVQGGLEHFVHAPITTIHLWFDREVADLDHAALLDTRIQWMFNKTRIRRSEPEASAGQYLELTISASFEELRRSREEILRSALDELERFFPRVRDAKLVKSGVLKEARATFSVLPGLDRFRPAADALANGIYLAGDWTRTGWPSTMEGAVRSGRLAAEAIARDAGGARNFLTENLAPAGLMRLVPVRRP